jgi:hypothetical protein
MSLDSEDSFEDFLKKAKEKDQYQANNIECFIIQKMKEEGFTEKQVYSMPMKRLWSLFMDSTSNNVTKMVSDMALLIEKNPGMAQKASPILEELTRNLEEMCDEMEAELKKKEKRKN